MSHLLVLSIAALVVMAVFSSGATAADIGPFTGHGDVGDPSKPGPGSAEYDATKKAVKITAGGANVWFAHDDMHFVWKKATGDVTLAANIEFGPQTAGADPHRKAVIMLRQSLDLDAAYADACIHGNGMTALQWRDVKGGISYQCQTNGEVPKRLRIEKRGNYFTMSIGTTDADLRPAGGSCRVELEGEYYVGIGLCSHSVERHETAVFSDIVQGVIPTGVPRVILNTLEVYQVSNRDRKVVYVQKQPGRFEAPNWSLDNTLYFNNGGRLYKIKPELPGNNPSSVKKGEPELVDLGILTRLNNDHVLSFDNKTWAVSDQSQGNRQSTIWTIPFGGGTPKKITEKTPSYCHGWSPDGKTLVYAAPREDNWDIYAISSDGGEEKRLTTTAGREDGPEYSPDGKYIYFNSDRTGQMQIWRMLPDGSQQVQVTKDDGWHNWFPHISPSGEQMVFISFDKTVASGDHPENKDVQLRLLNVKTNVITVVAKIFGGQGTINVPSWSPDSRFFAFVSYLRVEE